MGKKQKKDVVAPKAPKAAASEWTPENWVTLYSSEKGSISCPDHRPTESLDSWRLEGWRKLTGEEVEALEQELGHKPVCETCAAVERREAAERAAEAGAAPSADVVVAQPAGDGASATDAPAKPKRKGKTTKADAEVPATGTKPTLLWNERGQGGCTIPGHAPHNGTDTWKFEHWKKVPPGTLKEDGTPFACELCAKGGSLPAEPAAQTDPPQVEPETEAPKKKRNELFLVELALKYVKHMERAGKSSGTIASYQMELKTALDHFGGESKVADLTPEKVALYFGSARVNKKKNGRVKSPLSIAKTQRVLRLALVWAEGAKLIAKAPLPETLATH